MAALEVHKDSSNLPAIDHEAVLKTLNLNPRDPKTQALLLVCDRYGLDPLLKHAVLIQGSMYVTRDGYLAVAHRSGQFDGMEVLETGSDQTHYTAKVAVYRKDMSHPFTYVGRYPKQGGNKSYGPEMAVKCAEVMGLRRAFNVTGLPAADERWDDEAPPAERQVVPAAPAAPPNADPVTGEIRQIETTTRREPPKPKPGYVAAAEAKQRLVKAFTDQGISDETAKASAKELWGPRGRDAVTEEHLAQMLAQVAQPELPDENTDDGLGLPFDDTQEPA